MLATKQYTMKPCERLQVVTCLIIKKQDVFHFVLIFTAYLLLLSALRLLLFTYYVTIFSVITAILVALLPPLRNTVIPESTERSC